MRPGGLRSRFLGRAAMLLTLLLGAVLAAPASASTAAITAVPSAAGTPSASAGQGLRGDYYRSSNGTALDFATYTGTSIDSSLYGRHRGGRPLRRLDDGARGGTAPALPGVRPVPSLAGGVAGRCRRRPGQRHPGGGHRPATHRGHPRALRRRPRTRPGDRRRAAQADREPGPAGPGNRQCARRSGGRGDRRRPRAVQASFLAPSSLWA
jgi:hypothetical protein